MTFLLGLQAGWKRQQQWVWRSRIAGTHTPRMSPLSPLSPSLLSIIKVLVSRSICEQARLERSEGAPALGVCDLSGDDEVEAFFSVLLCSIDLSVRVYCMLLAVGSGGHIHTCVVRPRAFFVLGCFLRAGRVCDAGGRLGFDQEHQEHPHEGERKVKASRRVHRFGLVLSSPSPSPSTTSPLSLLLLFWSFLSPPSTTAHYLRPGGPANTCCIFTTAA